MCKQNERVKTGFVQLKICTSGKLLWKMDNELSVQGISWLAEELLASQDRLCSIDIVCGFSDDTDKLSSKFQISKSFYPDEYLPCKTLYYLFQPTNKVMYNFFIITNLIHKFLVHSHKLHKIKFLYMFRAQSFLSGCTRRSLAESDDTRGGIDTICVVDLLMMSGLRSKHVEEFNFM